jgi:7,8-dihydroneopterin aldolase/epimerase/oxygenase
MGIIALEGMKFRAYHGVYEHEKATGNDFIIDLYIRLDYERAALSDNIDNTINYEDYYKIVEEVMQQRYNLLEHINYRIIDAIHNKFRMIEWIKVRVKKLNPPVGGEISWIAAVDQKEFD